jgi:beta-lactam-binding protein with PASTA domain
VPNVVGQQETGAETTLQNAGFKVLVKPDPTSTQAAGLVLSQSPSTGTALPGSTVTITVSGGAVTVPPVVGDSQQTATTILSAAGFQVNVQQGSGPAQYGSGTVFAQQPAASTSLAKGSKVTIYVQAAATPSASPTPSPTGSGGPGGAGF